MYSSTEPTQAPPAHARMTRSAPATPSQGGPDRFGDALSQALAPAEPAATGTATATAAAAPPGPAEPMEGQPIAGAVPTLPAAMTAPETPLAAGPSKPAEDGPATPATEADQDEAVAEATQPSNDLQPSAPSQPPFPALPQAAPPPTAVPAEPSVAGDAGSSTVETGSAAAAAVEGRQAPATPAAEAAQPTAPATPQSLAPSATPPSRDTAPSAASDAVLHAVERHSSAVAAEKEPTAATPAIPADAAPLPAFAVAVPPNPAPAPLSLVQHPAPSQAPRPSAAPEPAPPSAAVQVGPVLASFAASAGRPGAPQHMTIRLDPLDLGRVQVHIERLPDGSARVDLKVEKPDTLLLLLRDQPQLHRALDLAGVPSTERTLQFHLAPPDATAPGPAAAQSNADQGHGQQRPGQPHSGRFAAHGPAPSLGEPLSGPAVFRRAGVDITA